MLTPPHPEKRLILVSYRLPFAAQPTPEGTTLRQNAGGLVSAVLSMAQRQAEGAFGGKIHWVGHGEDALLALEPSQLQNEQFIVHPVAIDPVVVEGYYEGFCNATLWPLFHYFPSYALFQEDHYRHYQEAHAQFRKTLAGLVRPGDQVWVHDYQLMLLPGQLRADHPYLSVGFFLHIPFPSYEVFKLMPRTWRQDLLEGMLGANLIGFHTTDYARHFCACVEEVLAFPMLADRVALPERSVQVGEFPISVDFQKFDEAGQQPDIQTLRQEYQRLLGHKKIIFSVDRLDYTKGIKERLLGYERFLTQEPHWHNQVTFVMTVVPSRDQIGQYQELKREIEETVGRINGRYGTIGWRPIVYSYASLSFDELLALYTACDVALITPIRDGMNLVAKEFVASRQDERGVLILSEMAGAVQELPQALVINPPDTQEVAAAIGQALAMPGGEQQTRLQTMREHLRQHDVFRWTDNFLRALQRRQAPEPGMLTDLPLDELVTAYRQARQRLLLLDYDGTLTPLVDNPAEARLPETVHRLLRQGCQESLLVIVSGRNRAFLEAVFGDMPVCLVAEHGAFIRYPASPWQQLSATSLDWSLLVRPLMEAYADRYAGTFVEEKETALAWHYRTSRSEEASQAATELAGLLRKLPSQTPLTVLEGTKVVEVKPAQHSKGTIARQLFQQQAVDFILSLGDDLTDEDMFGQLPNWAYSIKVGSGRSGARYRLARQADVARLLGLLFTVPDEIPAVVPVRAGHKAGQPR